MDWPLLEPNPYLDVRSGGDVRVRGTRVDLSVLVEDFNEGRLPEQMASDYPTLDLEAIYGVLAYYLGRRDVVDGYVRLCRERATDDHSRVIKEPVPPIVTRLRAIKAGAKAA